MWGAELYFSPSEASKSLKIADIFYHSLHCHWSYQLDFRVSIFKNLLWPRQVSTSMHRLCFCFLWKTLVILQIVGQILIVAMSVDIHQRCWSNHFQWFNLQQLFLQSIAPQPQLRIYMVCWFKKLNVAHSHKLIFQESIRTECEGENYSNILLTDTKLKF